MTHSTKNVSLKKKKNLVGSRLITHLTDPLISTAKKEKEYTHFDNCTNYCSL